MSAAAVTVLRIMGDEEKEKRKSINSFLST
jgi:hypothetical protein